LSRYIWLVELAEELSGTFRIVRIYDEHVRVWVMSITVSDDPDTRLPADGKVFEIPFGEAFYLETLTGISTEISLSFVFTRESDLSAYQD
jgi:hypothetical protein